LDRSTSRAGRRTCLRQLVVIYPFQGPGIKNKAYLLPLEVQYINEVLNLIHSLAIEV